MSETGFEFEIVVVGAGPAGISAACVAAECGKQVAVVDDTPWLGGQIWRGEQARPSQPQAQQWLERFRNSGATVLDRTSVIGAPGKGLLMAEHAGRPSEIHWRKLILATGARELFLPFPGWTLPGVMGPGGLQSLVKNGWPIGGKRVVICGTGPLLLAVAKGLQKYGAKIVGIAEQAPLSRIAEFGFGLLRHPAKMIQGLGMMGLGARLRCGVWPVKAEGEDTVRRVTLTDGRKTWTEDCDYLACGFHLVPNVELPLAVGCALENGFVRVDRWQATSAADVFCAGEPTGIGGADCALAEGQIAGYAAANHTARAETLFGQRAAWHSFRVALAKACALRPELKTLATDDTLLCRCEDVSLARVRQFASWREAKLLSRCGMGPCQGRVCGAAAKFILGWGMESVRPPVLPARIGSLVTTTNQK
ncbi:MAG TPA: FAD/NAD(P)-binding oxidoreductase [Candidatus Polarisedimenticolia bacterium]|nr:FAD/NAD(P)-binding oxidoreductase [Candidatus Polarisedimenticolia bacterium]